MLLYAYHLAQRAADILRWQDGLRQDGLHADEERLTPRQFCGSADVGLIAREPSLQSAARRVGLSLHRFHVFEDATVNLRREAPTQLCADLGLIFTIPPVLLIPVACLAHLVTVAHCKA